MPNEKEKTTEQVLDEAVKNMATTVKDVKEAKEAVEAVTKSLNDFKEENKGNLQVVKDEFQKQLDDIIAESDKKKVSDGRKETLKELITKSVEEQKDKLKEFTKGERESLNIQIKDITSSSFALPDTAYNPAFPAQITGIITPPQKQHVRGFLPQGQISGNGVYYISEDSYSPKAGYQAGEGAAKPVVDVDFKTDFAPVVTVAAILKVSRQAFDDSPYISSYINAMAPEKMLEFEDQELLYGDGQPNHIKGLFTAASEVTPDGDDDNRWDRIITILAQLSDAGYTADTILINEADALNMLKLKASGSGEYLFDGYTRMGGPLYIAGKQVGTLNAVNKGDVIAGNFASAAQLLFREGINIRIFEQNKDDVEKNMLTIRVEERIALPIYRPDALMKGELDGGAWSS